MPSRPVSKTEGERVLRMIETCLREGYAPKGAATGSRRPTALSEAMRRLGANLNSASSKLTNAEKAAGRTVDWKMAPDAVDIRVPLLNLLRRSAITVAVAAEKLKVPQKQIRAEIKALVDHGYNLHQFGDSWLVEKDTAPARASGKVFEYRSRPDGTYLFGFTSDNHLCSKYQRNDVLESLYDHFAAQGVDRVYNAGNWIDGEARFNKHDLLVHGWEPQLRYLAEHYPQRPGIVTYAVAGDDHEGWTAQREGLDPGRSAERIMREAGRTDWVDLGYMEAFVPLIHAKTKARTMLHVMHPGGGSAYATSYTVQKIAESYDGGEKPAVLLAGHYHKLAYNMARNVHCIQTGCTQDQTPFMRKKKLAAHVGGGICKLTQDPRTGAVIACQVEFFNYFVKGYHNERWSHASDVVLPERGTA